MKEKEILRQTSRSFYLTLRFLPRAIQAEASLGYLLARATDTIADSSSADSSQRLTILRAARESVGQNTIPAYEAGFWAAQQHAPAEKHLLQVLPSLWQRLGNLDDAAQQRLKNVLSPILEGQIFDLERFRLESSPLTDEELEHYTYLVAGSVGEFLTKLCAEKIPNFASDSLDVMLARAKHYGQALQLINILRDRSEDAALGRVYVQDIDAARWITTARQWLQEATPYGTTLRSRRLRYATVLPALLGWRTLALVEASLKTPQISCKVPRVEVRQWMVRSISAWWSAHAVKPLIHAAMVNKEPSPRRRV